MKNIGPKHQQNNAPSSGRMVKEYIQHHRITEAAVARKLNRNHTTLVKYFKSDTIQSAVLWEICEVLEYNFFQDFAEQLPSTFRHGPTADQKEIADLQSELASMRIKVEVLEKTLEELRKHRS